MSHRPIRVVKVGGSLFAFPALVETLEDWLDSQTPAMNVLVAGGGRLADVIRDADRRFSLGELPSHWLCVDVLAVSARLLATLLPASHLAVTLVDVRHRLSAGAVEYPIVFCPVHFLRHDEPRLAAPALPHNWTVTSDSIAARVAHALSADELVLLKSSDPPDPMPADSDYVDPHFFAASKGVPEVRFVNLRRYR
jgi:aspartokinase-like uncharacterized kinase